MTWVHPDICQHLYPYPDQEQGYVYGIAAINFMPISFPMTHCLSYVFSIWTVHAWVNILFSSEKTIHCFSLKNSFFKKLSLVNSLYIVFSVQGYSVVLPEKLQTGKWDVYR